MDQHANVPEPDRPKEFALGREVPPSDRRDGLGSDSGHQQKLWISHDLGGNQAMAKKKASGKAGGEIKLQPLGDRLVVERAESESVTAGGIVLPDSAKDKPARGVVISVGDGRLLDDGSRAPFQVKEGDLVLFTSYAGEEFKVGDRELLLMREEDVLAVIG